MEDRNPFDLGGRGGPERPRAAKTWTEEEQAEKLRGYLEIPPEHWENIRYGTHVRYYTRAGEFRPGGFVLKNPFDTNPRGTGELKRFMKLQNGFNEKIKGYVAWVAAYEDLLKVYIKPDAAVLVMVQNLEAAVQGLNKNIRKLAEHSKKLEQRLDALEHRR